MKEEEGEIHSEITTGKYKNFSSSQGTPAPNLWN
jgi:hypothetical protein